VRLDYQLTLEDFKAGLDVHRPSRFVSKTVGFLACIGMIGLGLLLPLIPGTASDSEVHTWSWICLSLGAVLLAGQIALEWKLRGLLRRQAAVSERTQVVVGDEGFGAESRGAKSQIAWQRFSDFRESEGHFLLYHSRDRYFVLPKRAFASAQDVAAFRALLQQKIKHP
jgi:hypothetical protein